MKKIFLLLVISLFSAAVFAQGEQKATQEEKGKVNAIVVKGDYDPSALAQAALKAHGGDKLKAMKTLIIRGSVDITTTAFTQAIPATFVTVIAGDKYLIDIQNPFQPMKQVFNGQQTFSSINGFMLPPITSLGFPLLPKIGEKGYEISPLPAGSKKKKGFRMTSPDGYYTDFYLDEKTDQIKGYESSYEVSGRLITTSAEIDKYRTIDGVVIPEKYAQRFDLGQMTAYAEFKSKEILINTEVADDVFSLGK